MTEAHPWLAGLRRKFASRLREERAAFQVLVASPYGEARDAMIERAHKLAGIAGMLGAAEVGEAAMRLEEALLAGQDHRAALAALDAAIARFIG